MKYIKLTQGKFAIIDDKDFPWLSKFNWCYSPTGYAVRGTRSRKENWQKLIYMHREIYGTNKNIDHIAEEAKNIYQKIALLQWGEFAIRKEVLPNPPQ